MHAIPHKRNSKFQQLYFLVGSCHTADGAYALLCNQREEREEALAQYKISVVREQAKKRSAERRLQSNDDVERLEAEADLMEIIRAHNNADVLVTAAKDELGFIQALIDKLQPLRQFAHLSDMEAHEAAQREEWKLELMHRAQNALLTTGHIPTDQWATMRMHPDFVSEIFPMIETFRKEIQTTGVSQDLISKLTAPKYLELTHIN